jgi:hypothetical protein
VSASAVSGSTDGSAHLLGGHPVGAVCIGCGAFGGSQPSVPLGMVRRAQEVGGHLRVDLGAELCGPGKVFGSLP